MWHLIVLLLILIISSRLLWKFYFLSQRDPSCPLPLPPGSAGWPFIGEMISFVCENVSGDFYRNRREKYGRIYRTHLFGMPIVRIAGSEHIKPILSKEHSHVTLYTPDTIRQLMGRNSLAMSQEHLHKERRKSVLKAFSYEALVSYTQPLDKIIFQELIKWCTLEKVKVFEAAEKLTFRAACEVLLGLEADGSKTDRLSALFHDYLGGFFTLPLNISGTPFNKALQAKEQIMKELDSTVQSMMEDNGNTTCNGKRIVSDIAFKNILNSASCDSSNGHKMSIEEIKDMFLEILFAGHKTVSSALTSLAMHLGNNTEVKKKLKNELEVNGLFDTGDEHLTYKHLYQCSYLGDVVKEVLRLSPPVGGGFRKTLQTLQIGDYQIPKGWTILYGILDTHEIADFHSNSKDFCPERWHNVKADYNFVPFGAGPRACAGRQYADLLIRVFAVNLMKHCDWTLESDSFKMARLPILHPKDQLPARFKHKQKVI